MGDRGMVVNTKILCPVISGTSHARLVAGKRLNQGANPKPWARPSDIECFSKRWAYMG